MNIIVLCMYVYFGIFLSIFQNVTLQELMDEDDVVQECKSSNKKLVDLYVIIFNIYLNPKCVIVQAIYAKIE